MSIYFGAHASAWSMLIESMGTDVVSPQVVGEIAYMDHPMTFRFIEEENILKIESLSL